jgi:hypothetical protein
VIIGSVIFIGILGFNLLGEGFRIRVSRQVASSGLFRKLAGERIEARYGGRYPLSVTDWIERHAVAAGTILVILLVSAGWLVWQDTSPVKVTTQGVPALSVPGGQLWATE